METNKIKNLTARFNDLLHTTDEDLARYVDEELGRRNGGSFEWLSDEHKVEVMAACREAGNVRDGVWNFINN